MATTDHTLRSLLARTFAALTLVLVLVLTLIVGWLVGGQMRRDIGDELAQLAFQIQDKLERGMFERYRDVRQLAQLIALAEVYREPERLRVWLDNTYSSYSGYAWIGFADPQGVIRTATGGLLEGVDAGQRPWFGAGLTGPHAGDVHQAALLARYLTQNGDEPLRFVDVAAPVVAADDTTVGVLAAHIRWDWAREVIESALAQQQGENLFQVMILSDQGQVLMAPRDSALEGSFLPLAVLLRHRNGYSPYYWPDDRRYLLGISRHSGHQDYPGLDWTVLVRQPANLALAPVRRLQGQLLLLGLGVSGLFLLLGWRLSGHLARPLVALNQAAARLRRHWGTLQVQGGYREIRDLSATLQGLLTERDRQTAALVRSESRLRSIVETAVDAIIVIDHQGIVESFNPAAESMFGFRADEVIGRNIKLLMPEQVSRHHDDYLKGHRQGSATVVIGRSRELMARRRDGSTFPVEVAISEMRLDGRLKYTGILHDVTERKAQEERLAHQATHDPLTDLPNRAFLEEHLALALHQAAREGHKLALLFLDLDQFKLINDTLGHQVGDALLVTMAGRLRGAVRDSDLVVRLGGDEFIVLLNRLEQPEDAAKVAQQLLQTLAEPVLAGGHRLTTAASIGMALYPDDGPDASTLLRHADTAMYHAKGEGRGTYRFFTPELNRRAQQRLRLENALRRALERPDEQFQLLYQPIVGNDGHTVRAEALLRWNPPDQPPIPPDVFIPIAEETGLIQPLGEWVFDRACAQLARWRQQGAGDALVRVAVNLSPRQLRPGLVEMIETALDRHGVEPALLKVEVTESALMQRLEESIDLLTRINRLGLQIAIDDFGTGYSSLAVLKRLPLDILKIDKSFVRDLTDDPDDAAIIAAIIAMARQLSLRVVAEGVETEAQWATLRALGCDDGQGWLFSHPLTPTQLLDWLARQNPPAQVQGHQGS